MEEKKDYYKILGVDKNATKDELKKKFRELSKQWHPDLCKDESKKEEYEEKFKEINEAYSVLSDDEKRAQYDNGGSFNFEGFSKGFNPFGGSPFDDFSDFFSWGFNNYSSSKQKNRVRKGSSLRMTVNVSLEDLYNGVKKKLKYKRYEVCPNCNGSGLEKDGYEEDCKHCGGTGSIFTQKGSLQMINTCPHCGGTGKHKVNPCHACQGSGISKVVKEIEIDIPNGTESGERFVYSGFGNCPENGNGIFGDLYVDINQIEDENLYRDGNDLYLIKKVPIIDCIMGGKITVDCLDKTKITVSISELTDNRQKLRVKGKGMPIKSNPSMHGDLYIIVSYDLPKALTDKEREILKELKQQDNFK